MTKGRMYGSIYDSMCMNKKDVLMDVLIMQS